MIRAVALQRALGDPHADLTRLNLAELHAQLGDREVALAECRELLAAARAGSASPTCGNPFAVAAHVHVALGDPAAAVTLADEGLDWLRPERDRRYVLSTLTTHCHGGPDGPSSGKAEWRLSPPRKFNWWFGTTSDLPWLLQR